MAKYPQEIMDRAEMIRDEMIKVARRLADRDIGALQSEMRAAQIEYLAGTLSTWTPLPDPPVAGAEG